MRDNVESVLWRPPAGLGTLLVVWQGGPVTDVIWSPTEEYVERANVTRFMRANGIATYDELVRRSVDDISWFWDAVIRDLDIEFLEPYDEVLDLSRGVEWATWFVGGRINLAHQCVDRWSAATPEAPAVVWEGEDGTTRTWTYAELRRETDRLARALRRLGVEAGDAVGIFLPMLPETVAAMMACSKIGAIWVPIFSGFGTDAVAVRLEDAGVKVLLTVDAFPRKGRAVPVIDTVRLALARVDTVREAVVLHHAGEGAGGGEHDWSQLVANESDDPLPAEPLESEHPLFIGYTSGTTGTPKGVLHVHGGFLVKVSSEVAYQVDLHRDEVLHWVTDLGWIMGPWEIVGALALGSTVFLYDGAPTHPAPDRLWSLVERHRITTLGVSPTLIRAIIPSGTDHIRRHDVSSLRILASTGEPWNPDPYRWLHREVGGSRLPIINLSGGTEVGACFLSPLPICELKPCTLRGPALGMDVDIVDPEGAPVGSGEVGELVCRQPWPAMTRGIWGDPERYLETYWRRFPGVWVHGDWATRDEDGFWFLHGRSDDTLSVAGKRLGPAEVESALASHPAVAESAAIGVPHPLKGETIWCFVVVKPGEDASSTLARTLRNVVADQLGRSFLPGKVIFVSELPKTRSAKIVRRAIRAAALGDDPGDLSSLEDPASLDAIRRAIADGAG
jgi:acetyl-CoA synthetase